MNAHQIRNILNDEAVNLFNLKGSHKAAKALNEFAGEATDAELIRFREILTTTEPHDWFNDPNCVASHHHY